MKGELSFESNSGRGGSGYLFIYEEKERCVSHQEGKLILVTKEAKREALTCIFLRWKRFIVTSAAIPEKSAG